MNLAMKVQRHVLNNITSAGAVDREFVYISSLPELFQSTSRPSQSSPRTLRAPPEPPRADPDLHSLLVPPELSHDVFSTLLGTSHAKPYVLRAFLEGTSPDLV